MIEVRYNRTDIFGRTQLVVDEATFSNEKELNRVIDIAFAKMCESPGNSVVIHGPEKIAFLWKNENTYKSDDITFYCNKKLRTFGRERAVNFAKQYAEKYMKEGYNLKY